MLFWQQLVVALRSLMSVFILLLQTKPGLQGGWDSIAARARKHQPVLSKRRQPKQHLLIRSRQDLG